MLTRPSWFHAGKLMDELHPPTCHVIQGHEIGIMTIFQLFTTNLALARVMSLRKGMEF
jgi:hypothetical protein